MTGFWIPNSEMTHIASKSLNALVAMSDVGLPARLKSLECGDILVVNSDAIHDSFDGRYQLFPLPITTLNREATAEAKLNRREVDRCKHFFALGLMYWLKERSLEPTLAWLHDKFAQNPVMDHANSLALKAGYNYAEATRLPRVDGLVILNSGFWLLDSVFCLDSPQ